MDNFILQENNTSINKDSDENTKLLISDKNLELNYETKLWVEKYRPTSLKDVIGNYRQIEKLKTWLNDFQKNKNDVQPSALIMGPPGIGKTTTAKCLLESFNYEVLEFNASDVRAQKKC